MQGMDPETGFLPEAKKLFDGEQVVYIKVAKGGQPICRWLEEWTDIAEKNGVDARTRKRILKDKGVEFYHPILDQYKELLKKHPRPKWAKDQMGPPNGTRPKMGPGQNIPKCK